MNEDLKQSASVGRIVHFRDDPDGPCLAAIIAGLDPDGSVNLSYFSRNGGHRQIQGVGEGTSQGTWHWPERV